MDGVEANAYGRCLLNREAGNKAARLWKVWGSHMDHIRVVGIEASAANPWRVCGSPSGHPPRPKDILIFTYLVGLRPSGVYTCTLRTDRVAPVGGVCIGCAERLVPEVPAPHTLASWCTTQRIRLRDQPPIAGS